ncbi:hypothetical protein L208DRAFT_1294878 [Tricholoma matsutake]|nr:hypothetical protein L208DRAFT_1294878 [Tricholoma matsutake 945]
MDLFADPRYGSQMTTAFTQQYADKHALEEQQRAVDVERLANIEKAKNHVIIYAWPKEDVEATVFEVQGGFKWPLFPLTPAILYDTDLMLLGEQQAWFKRYNPSIHTWTKVLVGHIVTLKASEHIFLKGYDIDNCWDFDCLLSASQESAPHFFKNISHERAYVR